MRFVTSLWLLVLSALLLFSFVVFFQHIFVPGLSLVGSKLLLVAAIWVLGVVTAATIHLLYLRSERAIRRAAQDEATAQLAGAVAHELNQPLTVVITGAELMAHRGRSPEDLLALSRQMAEASYRMADIVVKLQKATCYKAKPYVGGVHIADLDECG